MPLVRIDAPHLEADRLDQWGDIVHHALIDTFFIPEDDLFQVLTSSPTTSVRFDPEFLGITRSPNIVLIQITARRGRTEQQKRNLYRAIARSATAAGENPADAVIALTENELIDWSFANGDAQYADNPPPLVPHGPDTTPALD